VSFACNERWTRSKSCRLRIHDLNDRGKGSVPATLKDPSTAMLYPAMNDTKWDEVRLAMYALQPRPAYAVLSTNGHRSGWDREWFYHFRTEPYATILYVDIRTDDPAQHERVRAALRQVHVPGEETPEGFRVFGYLYAGQAADYLKQFRCSVPTTKPW
jgi:hypothetical protein